MNDWGTLSYDEEKKRWQWSSRYVTEADARASFLRRVLEQADSLLVRMAVPQPSVHQCGPDCACVSKVIQFEPSPFWVDAPRRLIDLTAELKKSPAE